MSINITEKQNIKRIVKSLSRIPILIKDLNVKLIKENDQVDLCLLESKESKQLSSLYEIHQSSNLIDLIKSGSLILTTETGKVFNNRNFKELDYNNAFYESLLNKIN